MLVVALFFMANASETKITPVSFNEVLMFRIIFHLFIEFGVFYLFLYKKIKHDKIFLVILATKFIFTLLLNDGKSEFIYKTSVALVFYTMLLIMGVSTKINLDNIKRSWKVKLLIAVMVIGAVTPAFEIIRTVTNTVAVVQNKSEDKFLSDGLHSAFEPNACYDNFIGSDDSVFYRYIMRT